MEEEVNKFELKVGDTFTAKTTFDGRAEVLSVNLETNVLKVKLTQRQQFLNDPEKTIIKVWEETWNLRNTLPVFDYDEYFLSSEFPEDFPPKDFKN